MLSKSQIRTLTSLQQKKFRKDLGLFIVEGLKSVSEFLQSNYQVEQVIGLPEMLTKVGNLPQNIKCFEASGNDMQRISALTNHAGILAVVSIPPARSEGDLIMKGRFTMILDEVQDPGNLGTIIRTADWFGFERIICSQGTVDVYNPKTVQASMGSLSRIQVYYMDLSRLLARKEVPVYAAVLDGQSIYETDFGKEGVILLGNEGKGISEEVLSYLDVPVTIPKVGGAESLNVALSAALFFAELARKPGWKGA
jgi:TrmH family RNA methyltransferase